MIGAANVSLYFKFTIAIPKKMMCFFQIALLQNNNY